MSAVLSLIDTNILVYRYDHRFASKQNVANEMLRRGVADQSIRVPHQAIVEFVAATSRRRDGSPPLLKPADARREAEEMLTIFEILYPTEPIVRLALRGAAAYQLAWFDANLWAYAEHFGLHQLISEDFEHNRLYGSVRAVNPFMEL